MSHSHLSPSASHRWVKCQESLKPVEGDHYAQDDEDNKYSKDGSAKHKFAQWCIEQKEEPISALLNEMKFHGLSVTPDMVDAVDFYVSTVNEYLAVDPEAQFWLEDRVYMEEVSPDMYGNLDCAIYRERTAHLIIGDGKYGYETVEAVDNWQLRCYALGKTAELENQGFKVEKITCFIAQPADDRKPLKEVEYDRRDLVAFTRILKRAIKGKAAEAGDHCKYCPRAHICPTLEQHVNEVASEAVERNPAAFDQLVTMRTPEEIARILHRQGAYKIWFAAVSGYAKQLLILGHDVPGWCLKESWGNRVYKDANEAEKILNNLYGNGIYEPRVLRSPAQIEKVWPDAKDLMAGTVSRSGLTERPYNGKTLKRKE